MVKAVRSRLLGMVLGNFVGQGLQKDLDNLAESFQKIISARVGY